MESGVNKANMWINRLFSLDKIQPQPRTKFTQPNRQCRGNKNKNNIIYREYEKTKDERSIIGEAFCASANTHFGILGHH